MKLSNEIKVGALAIIAITLGVWGYYFLKGKNLLAQSKIVYADYHDIGGLQESSPIKIQGHQVGIVTKIEPVTDPSSSTGVKLRVGLDFNTDFPIPKNAIAKITESGPLGGMFINIFFNKPCSSERGDCIEGGDVLTSGHSTFIGSIMETINGSVNRDSLKVGLDTLLNSLTSNKEVSETFKSLQSAMPSIDFAMNQMGTTLQKTSSGLEGTLNNLNKLTSELNNNMSTIQATLTNLHTVSGQIKDADISKTTASANKAMDELTVTMGVAQASLSSLQDITKKLNEGEGSLGRLINDDEFYTHLDKATYDLDMLLIDLRRNPKRYLSLFNKKKNREYTYWEEDPALKGYEVPKE